MKGSDAISAPRSRRTGQPRLDPAAVQNVASRCRRAGSRVLPYRPADGASGTRLALRTNPTTPVAELSCPRTCSTGRFRRNQFGRIEARLRLRRKGSRRRIKSKRSQRVGASDSAARPASGAKGGVRGGHVCENGRNAKIGRNNIDMTRAVCFVLQRRPIFLFSASPSGGARLRRPVTGATNVLIISKSTITTKSALYGRRTSDPRPCARRPGTPLHAYWAHGAGEAWGAPPRVTGGHSLLSGEAGRRRPEHVVKPGPFGGGPPSFRLGERPHGPSRSSSHTHDGEPKAYVSSWC